MNDKQINKWLRRQFSQVGWILVGYYAVMNVLALLGMFWEGFRQSLWAFAAGDFSGSFNWDSMYSNAWGYILTILVGMAMLHAWKGTDYWKEELFHREASMKPGTFGCLAVLCMGAQMLNGFWVSGLELVLNRFGKSASAMLESVSGDSDTVSMFLYASILAPIGEEILFRGYILRSLRPYGKRFAVMASAVLFGLFHGNLLQAPYAIFAGLLLGYAAVEYSLLWAVYLHMFNNLVLADLLTRLTASWPDVAYSGLNLILFGGALVISIALLVKHRQEVKDYRSREWMDRRVVKCFFFNFGILTMTAIAVVNMLSLFFM